MKRRDFLKLAAATLVAPKVLTGGTIAPMPSAKPNASRAWSKHLLDNSLKNTVFRPLTVKDKAEADLWLWLMESIDEDTIAALSGMR